MFHVEGLKIVLFAFYLESQKHDSEDDFVYDLYYAPNSTILNAESEM